MVAIHTNLPVNADLNQDTSDGTVDGTGASIDGAAIAAAAKALPPPAPTGIASSTFDGVKTSGTGNVLNTAPPALSAGQYVSTSLPEAMGRMQQLQNDHPFRSALMRSAEDGTAPAAPKQKAAVGASAVSPPTTVDASTVGAAPAGIKQMATVGASAAPADSTSNSSATVDPDSQQNNVDVGSAGQDLTAAANQIETDAAQTTQKLKGCSKEDAFTGEDALASRIQKMGVPKDQARTLAKMLNPLDNGSDANQNANDQQVVALAIAAYDKLNASGNQQAAGKIVQDLTDVANTNKNSTTNQTGSQAYYKALNTLGDYAISATSSSATGSLTSPNSSVKLVPYPIIGD